MVRQGSSPNSRAHLPTLHPTISSPKTVESPSTPGVAFLPGLVVLSAPRSASAGQTKRVSDAGRHVGGALHALCAAWCAQHQPLTLPGAYLAPARVQQLRVCGRAAVHAACGRAAGPAVGGRAAAAEAKGQEGSEARSSKGACRFIVTLSPASGLGRRQLCEPPAGGRRVRAPRPAWRSQVGQRGQVQSGDPATKHDKPRSHKEGVSGMLPRTPCANVKSAGTNAPSMQNCLVIVI